MPRKSTTCISDPATGLQNGAEDLQNEVKTCAAISTKSAQPGSRPVRSELIEKGRRDDI